MLSKGGSMILKEDFLQKSSVYRELIQEGMENHKAWEKRFYGDDAPLRSGKK